MPTTSATKSKKKTKRSSKALSSRVSMSPTKETAMDGNIPRKKKPESADPPVVNQLDADSFSVDKNSDEKSALNDIDSKNSSETTESYEPSEANDEPHSANNASSEHESDEDEAEINEDKVTDDEPTELKRVMKTLDLTRELIDYSGKDLMDKFHNYVHDLVHSSSHQRNDPTSVAIATIEMYDVFADFLSEVQRVNMFDRLSFLMRSLNPSVFNALQGIYIKLLINKKDLHEKSINKVSKSSKECTEAIQKHKMFELHSKKIDQSTHLSTDSQMCHVKIWMDNLEIAFDIRSGWKEATTFLAKTKSKKNGLMTNTIKKFNVFKHADYITESMILW